MSEIVTTNKCRCGKPATNFDFLRGEDICAEADIVRFNVVFGEADYNDWFEFHIKNSALDEKLKSDDDVKDEPKIFSSYYVTISVDDLSGFEDATSIDDLFSDVLASLDTDYMFESKVISVVKTAPVHVPDDPDGIVLQ